MLAAASTRACCCSSWGSARRLLMAGRGEGPRARRSLAAGASPPQDQQQQQPAPSVGAISVTELAELLQNPVLCEECQFVDVREPSEHAVARLPHFKLLPLSTASEWAPTIDDTLDPAKETLVLCHHGMRSMSAAQFLASRGFTNVRNVTGGIHAYSQVDRSVPEY